MTPLVFLLLSIAGGLGAACRFWLDGVIKAHTRMSYPIGTTVINVSGSFVLGLLTALTAGSVLPESVALIAGTGFLGGYTTFSTASYETVRLVQERRWLAGTVNGLGMLLLSVAAAALGLLCGSLA